MSSKTQFVISNKIKSCHPEDRAVCAPKDLNSQFWQVLGIDLPRLNATPNLRFPLLLTRTPTLSTILLCSQTQISRADFYNVLH
jgi:hypothetical protein